MVSKTVFITGASSGLGSQMAKELAGRGYNLALAARRQDALEKLRNDLLAKHPIRINVYALDVADIDAVSNTLTQAASDFGSLDIVVANAGIAVEQKIGRGDFANIKQVIDVNITGAFATVDAAMRIFDQQGFGHIVALSSFAACRGMPRLSSYSASKVALATYMEALRAESVHKKLDITVLYPGYIDTPMNADVDSRPFVISLEKGGKILTDLILKKVKRAHVPRFPWSLMAPIVKRLPTSIIAKSF